MNSFNRLVIPVLISCFTCLNLFAQDKKVDERVWSQTYWKKMAEQGLVEVAKQQPVKPAKYTGSKLNSLMLDTDDSPDVAIIDATNTTQSEISVFVNPLDDNKVLNSNNSTDFPVSNLFGASGFMSDDGGLTWTGSVQGTGGANSGDPAAAINLQGRYHNGYIAANGGNGAAWSDDEGVTWTDVQVAPNPGQLADKNHLWVDNSPSSSYEGHVYAAYTDFGGGNDGNIVIHTSTDRGASWGAGINISSGLVGFHQGVHIQTDANGVVYAFYTVYTSGGVTDEPAYGMSRSTDGGATWDTGTIIIDGVRGIRATGTLKNHRVAGFPVSAIDISGGARNNTLYLVWNNIGVPPSNTGPGINILMISSSDGGNTWTAPTVVNQDDPADGNENYFPWVACDAVTGALSIVFYSDRNVASTDCEAFAANSLDGGQTWEDFKISDVSFTPAPIPGLAGGYMGDYLGIASRGAKVYPVWADNRSGAVLAYVSPYILADPDDPNGPAAANAYSDFNTPTSIDLTWDDPTSLVDGTPILPGNFTIEIERDGSFLASVNGGVENYNDTGLTDGTNYSYSLTTKLVANDSLSLPVVVSWTAGGAADPAAPTNLACTSDTAQAFLTWVDPTTQSDGTPLDDLADIVILRDGFPVGSVSAGVQAFTDTPPNPGFVYTYTVQARDNETPPNSSAPSNAVDCYVGTIPNFLVWVAPTVAGPSVDSGDSLLAALIANGESSLLTNNLFEFGNDLSVYEAVFVVLGIYSDNHVLLATDPEGDALNTYIANGGHIYLEGGDCFNYDPEDAGGYQIRPWFGLDDGADGSADVAGVVGLNDLSQFGFAYSGPNNFMDELVPTGNSTPVWQNDANTDIHGVFNTDFGGRAIGVVPTFAGMDNNSNALYPLLRDIDVQKPENVVTEVKYVVVDKPIQPFTKKAGYKPELKREREDIKGLFEVTSAGVKIQANNKVDLMAAYLGLFRNTGAATIGIDSTALDAELLAGTTASQVFNITNTGGSLAGDLTVNIAQNPISAWLAVNPTSGTLSGNQSLAVTVTYDATGITAGTYNTVLEVTSNDLNTPQIDIPVELVVIEAPVAVIAPGSVSETLDFGDSTDVSITVENTGNSPLDWSAALAFGKTSIVDIKPTSASAEYDPAPPVQGLGDQNDVIYGFGDLIVEYDLDPLTGSASHLGVAYAQNHFWVTASQAGSPPNWIYKLDDAGTVVDSFSQPTTSWGWRDMAYDGTYLYGSVSPAVEQIDPATGQATGVTIAGPENPNRALAYDPATDHFWTVNFGGSMYEFDRSGTVINTFPNPVSSYGAAWDAVTPGGPWIWLHTGTSTGETHTMVRVNPTTGLVDGPSIVGTTGNIAGGLDLATDFSGAPGKAVLVALGQSFSLNVWDLDVATTPPFAKLVGNTSGTVNPGDVDGVTLRLIGSIADTTVTANLNFTTNDPASPSIDVPISLTIGDSTITGIGDLDRIPTTFAVEQNYPNPFNPSTTIQYEVPQVSDVSLAIYNTLGQKVRTLVRGTADVGVYQAVWNGLSDNGERVASGVYIYRFEAGSFSKIRKMVLLK